VVRFTPRRFTTRERDPCSHWIGGWVGPRAVLNAVVKRKIPSPHLESNPRTPIVQLIAQRYKLSRFIVVFKTARHCAPIMSHLNPISIITSCFALRPILILSSYLCLGLWCLVYSGFRTEVFYVFLVYHACDMLHLSHNLSFYHPNDIR
jgi:hypothetical protein